MQACSHSALTSYGDEVGLGPTLVCSPSGTSSFERDGLTVPPWKAPSA